MGRTLFWYIFKDLLKIFFMASGALAGIMSFGGLLRPLTQQGLDVSQVGKMLTYFTFPMMAYSLPVAALFSATMVYGRLSADNELTACRAGGISHLGVAMPAFVLGIVVAAMSLLMLSFVVPVYTLKVERVVYSNLAKLIANRIDRTHEIRFGDYTVFAQKAYLPPPDREHPERQVVILDGVSIVTYERPAPGDRASAGPIAAAQEGDEKPDKAAKSGKADRKAGPKGGGRDAPARSDAPPDSPDEADAAEEGPSAPPDPRMKKPREFLMASTATLEIHERDDDQVDMLIGLEGGTKFPREFKKGTQLGIGTSQFGPLEFPSPVREDTKFMKIGALHRLYDHPEESRRIKGMVAGYVRHDQIVRYLRMVKDDLNRENVRRYTFDDPAGPVTISLSNEIVQTLPNGTKTRLTAREEGPWAEELIVAGDAPGAVVFERGGDAPTIQLAKEVRLRFRPDTDKRVMHVTVDLLGRTPTGGGKPVSGNYSDVVTVPMSNEVSKLVSRRTGYYLQPDVMPAGELGKLKRELTVLYNGILAEGNGRASFAFSCFILVLVGCALGMMFRSGNFLTAFAVSFVPALLCITLIVSGQQTCHAVPWQPDKPNPLRLGLMVIWSGNAINFVIATSLLWRLQRQ